MRTVHKFVVDVNDRQQAFYLHRGAKIVHVDSQRGEIDVVTFWAEVDTDGPADEQRTFLVIGTGHPIPEGATHVGTVLPRGAAGELVWHLFELQALSMR